MVTEGRVPDVQPVLPEQTALRGVADGGGRQQRLLQGVSAQARPQTAAGRLPLETCTEDNKIPASAEGRSDRICILSS